MTSTLIYTVERRGVGGIGAVMPEPDLKRKALEFIVTERACADEFKEDGVLVEQDGPVFGRGSHRETLGRQVPEVHFSNFQVTVDEDSPHIIVLSIASFLCFAAAAWAFRRPTLNDLPMLIRRARSSGVTAKNIKRRLQFLK